MMAARLRGHQAQPAHRFRIINESRGTIRIGFGIALLWGDQSCRAHKSLARHQHVNNRLHLLFCKVYYLISLCQGSQRDQY